MADVTFRAEFDDSAVQAAINKNIAGVEKLQGEFDQLGNKAGEAMEQTATATKAATKDIAKVPAVLDKSTKATGLLAKGMRILRAAIISTGIGALVVAAGALITALLKAKPVADLLADSLAAVGRIVTELIERSVQFAGGLKEIFSGNIKAGLASIGGSVQSLGSSLAEAAKEGFELSRALREIQNQEEDLALDIAQQQEALTRLKAIRDDDTKSFRERQAAARQLAATEREFVQRDIQFLQQRLDIANKNAEASRVQRADSEGRVRLTEEQLALQIELGKAQGKLAELDIDSARAQDSLRKAARDAAKARRAELAELNKQAQAFLDQLEKLRTGQLSGIERVRAERAIALRQLDEQEAAMRALFEQRGQQFNLEAEFERARVLTAANASREIRAILLAETKEREQLQAKLREAESKAISDAQKERLDEIEIGKQILLARVDLLERGNKAEEDFAIEIARRKLEIEINAQRARLEVVQAQYGENSPEVLLAREQIRLLEKEYEKAGEIDISGFDRLKQKILSALGITEAEAAQVLQLSSKAIGAVTGLIDAGLDAQIEQQDKLVDAIRSRIQETEGLLREEQRRAEQGYANDAALFEENLKKQQQALEKAEEEKAKLQEQATKRQLRQNQLQAASEYALLVIRLISSQATKGIIGIGIALGGLALVARIIAQQKAAAAKLVSLREGTEFVEGPGTGTSDSIPAWLSRGERVTSAEDNMEMGGRALSNSEMVRLVKLGRLVDSGSFAPANAEARRDTEQIGEMRVMVDMKIAEKAYREAANEAAERIVASVEARPVVIPAGDVTIVERKKGGVKSRDIIRRK